MQNDPTLSMSNCTASVLFNPYFEERKKKGGGGVGRNGTNGENFVEHVILLKQMSLFFLLLLGLFFFFSFKTLCSFSSFVSLLPTPTKPTLSSCVCVVVIPKEL